MVYGVGGPRAVRKDRSLDLDVEVVVRALDVAVDVKEGWGVSGASPEGVGSQRGVTRRVGCRLGFTPVDVKERELCRLVRPLEAPTDVDALDQLPRIRGVLIG